MRIITFGNSFMMIKGLFYIFLACFTLTSIVAASSTPLSEYPVVRDKTSLLSNTQLKESLFVDKNGLTKVWIFFRDKEILSKTEFDITAASLSLNSRTLLRRKKVGLDKILFADIPVSETYVGRIVLTGAVHRRSSRWLNAASFELPLALVEQVAAFPEVSEIRPLALFKRESRIDKNNLHNPADENSIASLSPTPSPAPLSPNSLKYGNSFAQLQQIGVPTLHARGFTGKGVTLAIFDTGFRKSHQAFTSHFDDSRVLAEYDFIFNDNNTANDTLQGDSPAQWDHGTYIWSVCGGSKDGKIFGPAYEANFILCKTEDIRSETPVEEDNWVAALEWVESLGADVVTSSIGYLAWYTYEDLDGKTTVITQAANIADSLGIVICNAMGNYGSSPGSLIAPADAHNILAIGAVTSNGTLANFSSRGPTFDGRIKPELLARGVSTFSASALGDDTYTTVSGTSLSTPLVAGAVCLLIQAHPQFTPAMIRTSLLETASQAQSPDNNYGWGIMNAESAFGWGISVQADTTIGDAPLTVQFTASTIFNPLSWTWNFGDGLIGSGQNISHTYDLPGVYSPSVTINTEFGDISKFLGEQIVVLGDTLWISGDSAFAGENITLSVTIQNSQPLESILLPFNLGGEPFALSFDSATIGSRTQNFSAPIITGSDPSRNNYVIQTIALDNNSPLNPGLGEVMKLFLNIDRTALGDRRLIISTLPVGGFKASFNSDIMTYNPITHDGWAATKDIKRGDVDYSNDGRINIADVAYLISYLFLFDTPPMTLQSGDVNADRTISMQDLIYLIDYLYLAGPSIPNP